MQVVFKHILVIYFKKREISLSPCIFMSKLLWKFNEVILLLCNIYMFTFEYWYQTLMFIIQNKLHTCL
jgi:hypothetical protein